jgi:polar amino acid transport system substrate-binding protein
MLSGMPIGTLLMKLALVIPLIAFPFKAGAYGSVLDRILQTGTVKIAVPENFPPFGDLGADAKLQGYDIETAAALSSTWSRCQAQTGSHT